MRNRTDFPLIDHNTKKISFIYVQSSTATINQFIFLYYQNNVSNKILIYKGHN